MACASWVFQPSLNPATTCFTAASSPLFAESSVAAARAKPIASGVARSRIKIARNRLGSLVAALVGLVFMLRAPRSIEGFIRKSLTEFVLEHGHAIPAPWRRVYLPLRVHQFWHRSNTCEQGSIRWRPSRIFATHLFIMASKEDDRHCGGVLMKIRPLLIASLAACLLAIAGPAFAHHAWHGYDMQNLTSLKGT